MMPELNNLENEMFEERFKFNWHHFFIMMAAFVPTLILFIVNLTRKDLHSNILGYVLFVTFVPYILWALFMAQKMNLIGAYGETILLLIPTFVWLLPGNDNAIWVMIIISLALILLGLILYVVAKIGSYFSTKRSEKKWKVLMPFMIRLSFVAMSVVSTLIVSIVLINFGDHSLRLASLKNDGSGQTDYTSSPWIVFIAIVTIVVALGLVLLGLASQFNFHFIRQNNKSIKQAVALRRNNKIIIKSKFLKKILLRPGKKKWRNK